MSAVVDKPAAAGAALAAPWEAAYWAEVCVPREVWVSGFWDYARGRRAEEHPNYGDAVAMAESQGWNGWWIKRWSDVGAVIEHGCWFSEKAALRVCRFFKRWIRASKGKHAGKLIPLIDWQVYDFLAPLFGWMNPDGLRRFLNWALWIAKKNGKSTLSSGLALYLLMKDGEAGPEVYTAAGDKKQAGIIFDESMKMGQAEPALAERLVFRKSKKEIEYPDNSGYYCALSADVKLKEGINWSALLFDELHTQKTRDMWDTLVGGGVAREQGLRGSLSTAGVYDPTSIGWEEWTYGEGVLDGTINDPYYFCLRYCCDDKADPADPENWRKANPSIGVTVFERNLEQIYKAASKALAKLDQFKRYHMNIWVRGFNRWIDVVHWQTLGRRYTAESLQGRPCFGGLDLASVDDTTSLVLWFPPAEGSDEKARILSWFWLPADNLAILAERHGAPYQRWADENYLKLTPGRRLNYGELLEDVLSITREYQVEELRYDPANAQKFNEDLARAGLTMVEQPQGFRTFSPMIKALDIAITNGDVEHNGNPVMDWQMGNTQVSIDPQENWKLVKASKGLKFKIDGPVAAVMASAPALTCPGAEGLPEEGIRSL